LTISTAAAIMPVMATMAKISLKLRPWPRLSQLTR